MYCTVIALINASNKFHVPINQKLKIFAHFIVMKKMITLIEKMVMLDMNKIKIS